MSDDWQPGDMALCIKVGPWVSTATGKIRTDVPIKGGMFCTVRKVGFNARSNALWFKEDLRDDRTLSAYLPDRFVKIAPEEADEFDRETIDLYNKQPQETEKA